MKSSGEKSLAEVSEKLGHKSLVAECFHCLYIEYGYRTNNTLSAAFLSLFSLHNETMNIWSHLIGFICVLGATINVSLELMSAYEIEMYEVIAFECYLFCAMFCLLCSTLYHWFGYISEECYDCLLKIDLTGIGLLVTGSFVPGVYYGFYCQPDIQAFWFFMTGFVFLVGLCAPWINMEIGGVRVRPFVLASLVAIGFGPFIHWLLITPTIYTENLTKEFLLMFFWYALGFTFFMTRFPEKWYPDSYVATHVISSHTLWHICVLNAVYVWFYFLLEYRSLLGTVGCSPYNTCANNDTCVA